MLKKKIEGEIEGFSAIVKSVTRKADANGNEIGEVNIAPIEVSIHTLKKIPVGRVIITIQKAQPPLFGNETDEEE